MPKRKRAKPKTDERKCVSTPWKAKRYLIQAVAESVSAIGRLETRPMRPHRGDQKLNSRPERPSTMMLIVGTNKNSDIFIV